MPTETELTEQLADISDSLRQIRESIRSDGRRHQAQLEAQAETNVALGAFAEASSGVETNQQLRHKALVETLLTVQELIVSTMHSAEGAILDSVNAQTGVIQTKIQYQGKTVEMVGLKEKKDGSVLGGLVKIDDKYFQINRASVTLIQKIGPIVLAPLFVFLGHYWHVFLPAFMAAWHTKGH
jgi:hypothetical protein